MLREASSLPLFYDGRVSMWSFPPESRAEPAFRIWYHMS